MQKHPRITKKIKVGNCNFQVQLITQNQPVSPKAYSRYITKANFAHKPKQGIRAYKLPCGCYIWQYSCGKRELSALPF